MNFQEASSQLRWLFREARGEMGLRSNFGAMVAQLEGGGARSDPSTEIDLRAMEAACKAREIEDSLSRIQVWARVVLGIAFRYFDGEQRLVAATTDAVKAHKASRTRREVADWLEKSRLSKDPKRRASWAALRARGKDLIDSALQLYCDAQRESPQSPRAQ